MDESGGPQFSPDEESEPNWKEIEATLTTGRIVGAMPPPERRSLPTVTVQRDRHETTAVYKSLKTEIEIAYPEFAGLANHLPHREVATYSLSQSLGFNRVPPTVEISSAQIEQLEQVTRQLFPITDGGTLIAKVRGDYPSVRDLRACQEDPALFRQLSECAIILYLSGNLNGYLRNVIFDQSRRQFYLIDHEYTFPSYAQGRQLEPVLGIRKELAVETEPYGRMPSELYQTIMAFRRVEILTQFLSDLDRLGVTEHEQQNFRERLERLIEAGGRFL